ncbi:MAG: Crp/Fnr family transcriptional regulator [Caldilineaceae bacterium]|nr:Crp/Fnr family transcriptional regulator [Caldilineaceae bacterium]
MNNQPDATHSQAVAALLQKVSLLQGIPDAALQQLVASAVRRSLSAGTILFMEGDPVVGFYLIESGQVKISRLSQDGREHILLILNEGDTFNEVAALDGDPNPATATAHTDATVHCILRAELRKIVYENPDLAWAMIESISRRARHLVGMVQDLSMRSVKGRLANLLLDQAEADEADAVARMLTQEEMASRLGTVREMVGRALRSLATDGIIEFDRHRIVILDVERLRKEAEV